MTLGENIKKQRERLKLSQEYVAEQLGVSRQAVSKWETGQSEPTAGNLVQLAKVFEISLSELADPEGANGQGEACSKQPAQKQPNPILRANLIKIAIAAQAAFLFNSASMFCQMQDAKSMPPAKQKVNKGKQGKKKAAVKQMQQDMNDMSGE